MLLYDTMGHGYKIDYQAVLGGGEPGVSRSGRTAFRCCGSSSRAARWIRWRSLAAPEFGEAKFGEQTQQAATVFGPNDFFGVLPDGTAWVARGAGKSGGLARADGNWSRGRAAEFTKVPVTQADKDRVLAQVREQGKQYGMPQELQIRIRLPTSKPPFDFALGRPNGEVWLQRSARRGRRSDHVRRVRPERGIGSGR